MSPKGLWFDPLHPHSAFQSVLGQDTDLKRPCWQCMNDVIEKALHLGALYKYVL